MMSTHELFSSVRLPLARAVAAMIFLSAVAILCTAGVAGMDVTETVTRVAPAIGDWKATTLFAAVAILCIVGMCILAAFIGTKLVQLIESTAKAVTASSDMLSKVAEEIKWCRDRGR